MGVPAEFMDVAGFLKITGRFGASVKLFGVRMKNVKIPGRGGARWRGPRFSWKGIWRDLRFENVLSNPLFARKMKHSQCSNLAKFLSRKAGDPSSELRLALVY